MHPLTHFPFAKTPLPRHLLPTVTHLLNYFQCAIFLYFFTFTVYYHEKYAKIDNCHVASAVLDRNSMELTMVFLFDTDGARNDLFFVEGPENATKMELKRPGLVENRQIMIWSSKISDPDEIFIHAEHPKSIRLELETGRPTLQIYPQEPYEESHDVVTCMTPVANNLELGLTALTSSISMGSFVHLPYTQLPGELYKFLRVFEKSGNLRLSANPLLREIPTPRGENAQKSAKNRADLAQLHCFLMYRSESKFIIFQDSLDTLLPIASESLSYFSEFSSIFQLPRVDGYGILEYNARIQVQKSLGDFTEFSVHSALAEATVEVLSAGRTSNFVVKTSTSNSLLSSSSRGRLYTIRNPLSASKISPKIMESIDKIIDVAEESDTFWTLLKSCSERKSWRCASGKCIRPAIRHRTLQGWYSYNIHFSQFIRVDSFDC